MSAFALAVLAVLMVAAGCAQAAQGRGAAKAREQLEPLSGRSFAINWEKVRLPGVSVIPPGTIARCDMKASEDYKLRRVTAYYFSAGGQDLAVLPARCAFNQSQENFFLYALARHGRPRLREVIYQSEGTATGLLTRSVPTAALAATRPHGWSGWFEWASPNIVPSLVEIRKVPAGTRGVELTGSRLIIRGLVIPAGAHPPDPAYSVRGLKFGAYIFAWRDGLFRFVRATTGAAPARPAR
jgi:hypothetical protein